jgi:hypothetical protein
MTDRSEAERVAKGLTKPMIRALLRRLSGPDLNWMPAVYGNTEKALCSRGLLSRGSAPAFFREITPFGLAVRAILQENTDAQ